jgi:YHS domain-containing protein
VGVVLWIVRILILLLILRFVLRLVFSLLQSAKSAPPVSSGGTLERAGGELVRDPQCGTYIPKSRAVVAGSGADVKYFCSIECRNKFAVKT